MGIRVDIEELRRCLEKARYVKADDEVRSDDYNVRVECLKKLGDVVASLSPGDPSIGELRERLGALGYVRAGDIILPEHHNLVVDALKATLSILEEKILRVMGELIGEYLVLGEFKIDKDIIRTNELIGEFKIDKDILKTNLIEKTVLINGVTSEYKLTLELRVR